MRTAGAARRLAIDETGAITPGAVVGVAFLAVVGYILLGFTGGDADRHGRLGIPGAAVIELPAGESKVYYMQGEGSSAGGVPEDLHVQITDPAGSAVEIDPRSADPDTRDGETVHLIGSINPERSGGFAVRTESEDRAGRIAPQVSFGQSDFGAVGERLDSVLDALLGPLGILLAALVFAIFYIPRLRLAQARRRRE